MHAYFESCTRAFFITRCVVKISRLVFRLDLLCVRATLIKVTQCRRNWIGSTGYQWLPTAPSFRDIARYWPKIAKFSPPNPYLTPLHGVFPLKLDNTGRAQETGIMKLPDREKGLLISLALPVIKHECDRQTDGHRPTASTTITRRSVAR